ncbi:putative ACR [Candidatus Burarchaeum australiense]|nr:putative ACR [Candidatus Burarchaeum australiense]
MGKLYNKRSRAVLANSLDVADSFFARARGLMFKSEVRRPLLFVFDEGKAKSRQACAIHALFVFFSFSAIYLDAAKRVVDVRVCDPFFSFVVPKKRSAYLIEGTPALAGKVRVGDVLEF